MNPTTTLLLACVLSAGTGAIAATVVAPAPAPSTETAGPSAAELEVLLRRLDAVEEDSARLDEALRTLGERNLVPPTAERVPVGAIQDAVAAWLSENGYGEGAASTAPVAVEASADAGPDYDAILARLRSGELDHDEQWALLEELALAKQLDPMIERYEDLLAADPNNPDAHVDVARVYLAKIQEVGNGPKAGLWAGKADRAYDSALDLNEDHWGARFGKATALSFWPPIFGKQGEAIQQFEILVEKQTALSPEKHHAGTFLYLGNLYQQTGEKEKAVAAWKQGFEQFPENLELQNKLESFTEQ